jgi:hypothetical protein
VEEVMQGIIASSSMVILLTVIDILMGGSPGVCEVTGFMVVAVAIGIILDRVGL